VSAPRYSILKRLRPPYTQPVKVAYGFSRSAPTNYGLTLAIPAGQPLVSPGDGTVELITVMGAKWRNDLGLVRSLAVRIDHGSGVKTYIHGLSQVAVHYGPITRGTLLGLAAQDQVFFGVEYDGALQDPTHINRYFGLMDGDLGYQKASKLHQAPDLITTAVSLIESLLWQGIRYFIPPTPVPVLFNLDFNGAGDKSGAAVVGSPGDVWNAIPAMDFGALTNYYNCYGGVKFPSSQGFFLNDLNGQATKVWFQRGVLTAAAGQTPFFDPMLSTWVGGYTGITPLVNSFTLRNLPAGTYDLYVYANGGATNDSSTFYSSVDSAPPSIKTATPTLTAEWVEDANYVHFDSLAVPAKGSVTVAVYGYLAGLQLIRT
jgi:hypothetical protein